MPDAHAAESSRLYLGAVLALQALCWVLAPVLVAHAPPLDIIENSIWGSEGVLVSYKNPALTGLLLEAARQLGGTIGWPAYVLSQLCVALALWIVYVLGRDVLGPSRAAIGAMALLACYYFNWRTPEFNHDILQLPLWAIVLLCLWRATSNGGLLWWVLMGLASAASLYGKLSAAVLLASCFFWLLSDRRARACLVTAGPWVALVVFLLSVAPLALALAHNDMLGTIQAYATERGNKRAYSIPVWIALQAAMAAPIALIVWASVNAKGGATGPAADLTSVHEARRAFLRFAVFLTLMPMALAACLAVFHGTGAKLMWGGPMLNLVGLILVAAPASPITAQQIRRAALLTALVIIGTATAYALTHAYKPALGKKPSRLNWPQEAIALRMREIWTTQTGAPLRIVAGEPDNWVSGIVALTGKPTASVFTEGYPKFSPWITQQRLQREGALIVWDVRGDAPSKRLWRLIGFRVQRFEEFAIPGSRPARSVTIGYAVIRPGETIDFAALSAEVDPE